MNKKKLITTIIIDLIALTILIGAVYLLMFKELKEWQSNLATVLIVIAFPTIFYSLFTQFATDKYGKMKVKDDKLWDELEEQTKEELEESESTTE